MPYRMIQVGAGGMGAAWCKMILPPFVKDGLIEVVAAVDINPVVLENAQAGLGLSPDRCYTDVQRAFDENPADFCTIVVPPAAHEMVVDLALAHDMHILSEKPIADTMEASVRIAKKVRRAGKKMGVTMSHRFDQDKTTLREELRSGRYGALDYLVCRFTCDCRRFGSWGKFRHETPIRSWSRGRSTTWISWQTSRAPSATLSTPRPGSPNGASSPVMLRPW